MESITSDEATILAREMANAFGRMVEHFKTYNGMDHARAVKEASTFLEPLAQDAASWPVDQVSWHTLAHYGDNKTPVAIALWERVKREARADLDSGHNAARAIESNGSPYQRALFLAVRASMIEDWQPRGGVEARLIDMMAQSFMLWQFWLNALTIWANHMAKRDEPDSNGAIRFPTMSEGDAANEAATMADRFNRVFLRTLRALRDLRRYPLTIGRVGQLNVGQHQTNTAQLTGNGSEQS